MVEYRTFRNTDPPGLAEVWNECFTNRGAYHLRGCGALERYWFAKPYFDPQGLIVAEEGRRLVGFAHTGFGPNRTETAINRHVGVLCALGVRVSHRRKGIGSELLERGEDYLRRRGAAELYAGPMRPFNPFNFGLYGGSDQPGFLASDPDAAPFLEYHGYAGGDTCLVFQHRLDLPLEVADARFAAHRKRFEIRLVPQIELETWWQDCVVGLHEPIEFRLEDRLTNRVAARAVAWEMDGFSWTWGLPAVGLLDVSVREDLRRQGVGKFLLAQLLRYMQDQFFGIVEVQTPERNQAAANLFRAVGFERVDAGRIYRKGKAGPP